MSQANFKKMVHWFGLVLMFFALGAFFKELFLQNMIIESLRHEDGAAFTITVVYALIFPVILCLSYGLHVGRESETRRLTVKRISTADFNAKHFWQGEIKENMLRAGIFCILQLPMLLLCSMVDYAFEYQTGVEIFFSGTAGFYIMTPLPLIGWLLSGIYLFALLMLTRYIQLCVWKRDSTVV